MTMDPSLVDNAKLWKFLLMTLKTQNLTTLTAGTVQALVVANGVAECQTEEQRKTIRLMVKQLLLDNKREILCTPMISLTPPPPPLSERSRLFFSACAVAAVRHRSLLTARKAAQSTLTGSRGRSSSARGARGKAAKAKPKKKATKPKRAAVMTKTMSPELLAVCGEATSNHFSITKLVWKYIKENNLQNPENKKEILCDEKMKAVFKVDKINGFSMSKHWNLHLYEKE